MLIIPLTGKLSWRNPPYVTIVLILINCLVFFIFQIGDSQRLYEAENFYFETGLAEIELPHYFQHLKKTGEMSDASLDFSDLDDEDLGQCYLLMSQDHQFTESLRSGKIITSTDQDYGEWQQLRPLYDQKLAAVVTLTYGFRPAYRSPVTFFTYMFMHGGIGHLFGNMLFLWILGCALEMGYGRVFYPIIYIIGGICAAGLFWLVYMDSAVPLVGASGSIAGLMGAFTLLYGRKKINIFLTTGFFFSYVKISAIILLPIWIGKELIQLFFAGVSQIAYVAHIGGLISGALVGYINYRFLGIADENALNDVQEDEISPLMESALERISELDLEKARSILEKILEKDPGNTDALTHLFNIDKNDPQDKRFHITVKRMLIVLRQTKADPQIAYKMYQEYLGLVDQPRLSSDLYLYICTICAANGNLEDAKRILASLLKHKADLSGIPAALVKLADAYRRKGRQDGWKKCLQVLFARYPDSSEAQMAKKSLRN